jgi:deoxyribonuclease-4
LTRPDPAHSGTGRLAEDSPFLDIRAVPGVEKAGQDVTLAIIWAMLFGAHCSTAGGVHMALRRAQAIGGECVQLFVKNNMQWFGKPPSGEHIELYAKELEANAFACVFGHSGYLINLASQPSANRDRSLESLIQEVQLATALGLPFLVLHPGAHLGAGERAGLEQAAAGLDEVFRATKRSPVRIALENTAGQGTCLGGKLEELAAIYDKVNYPRRLGLCLDTAHLFAAGYDVRTQKGWNSVVRRVEKLVGRREILAFHLNDSKTELGSHVDRHEHIGQGKIGKQGFRHMVSDSRFKRHPGCLETPKSADAHEDLMNLAALRALAAG